MSFRKESELHLIFPNGTVQARMLLKIYCLPSVMQMRFISTVKKAYPNSLIYIWKKCIIFYQDFLKNEITMLHFTTTVNLFRLLSLINFQQSYENNADIFLKRSGLLPGYYITDKKAKTFGLAPGRVTCKICSGQDLARSR